MAGQQDLSRAYGFLLKQKRLRFANFLKPYVWPLSLGCVLVLFTNLIAVCMPLLVNGGVSLIEKNKPFLLNLFWFNITFNSIYVILLSVVLLAIIAALIRTLSRMVIFDVGRTIERDIRAKLFYFVSILDDAFFRKYSVGDLMNHLTTDITNIRMVNGFASLNIMNIIFIFFFTVPLLLKIDFVLAACALLPFPLVIIATRGITKRMFLGMQDYQAQLSHMTSHLQENLLGAHIVRLFRQQENEGMRFSKVNKDTYDAGLRLAKARVFMMPTMRLMVGLAVGLVLFVGGNEVFSGRITLGDFVEVNARILQLAWPAMSVGFVMSVYSRGQASVMRINQLLSYMPTIKDGTKEIHDIRKIDVHAINLVDSSKMSFSIEKGQLLGIVGLSGSYKTTLLKALYRRIPIPYGTIFFDEHDINELTMQSIYQHVSVVPQETFLFNKSIRDNICFARPEASTDELHEVLALVRLDKDLANFKNGLDTVIGERGVTLSGGQRQRVALARALLAKRPVLIMDDALSSVDADTEQHIISRLHDFLKESIVIIATHRLSAIKNAHEILVLEQGRVLESGTHEQLMKDGALYKSLWGFDQLTSLTD